MTTPIPSPEILQPFRAALDRAGYTEHGVRDALGAPDGVIFLRQKLAVHRRRLVDGDPLTTLIRLFLLQESVPQSEAAAIIDVDGLRAVGFLEAGDPVRSTLRLVPFEDLVVAGEPDDPLDERTDHVPTVHLASRALANLTIRRPVARAFDLGTGCGIHALLAASHAQTVVASDVNARAIAFARVNAAMNAVANIDVRQGSWFAPVAGERFDLIVANPPFVLGPDHAFVYRDAGAGGDAVCRDVVVGAAEALAPGGYASVLCNWVVTDLDDWWAPAAAWLRESACDAWILATTVTDPLDYAAAHNLALSDRDPDAYERQIARSASHFADAGVRWIAVGAIVMRRHPESGGGQRWVRPATLHDEPGAAAGEQLARMFDGVDSLAGIDDAALLASRVRPLDGHRIDEVFERAGSAYAAASARIRHAGGVGIHVVIDPLVLAVLFGCDGASTLEDIIARAADAVGETTQRLTTPALAAVRGLVEAGIYAVTP